MALPSWWDTVKAPFRNRGVPVDIWLPILFAESSGNPNAHNRGTPSVPEDSIGLFQLNRKGGQGAGYSVEQLMNPALNAEIASRYIAEGYQRCQARGDGSVACVAVNSGHPGNVPRDDRRILWIVQLWEAVKTGGNETDKWARAVAKVGAGPTEPGPGGGGDEVPGGGIGDLLPDFPSGQEIGQGLVTAVWESTMRGISAAFKIQDPRDIGWSVAFGVAGMVLVSVGLIGVAIGSGAPEKAAGVVLATVPAPQAKAGAAAVLAGSRAIRNVLP
jgi:hypothetical protein